MFERRLYHHIDWAMLTAMLALCALGVATIYSATFDPTRGASHRYITQVYAIALGLAAMMFMLAGHARDLPTRPMVGFHPEKLGALAGAPSHWIAVMAILIGHPRVASVAAPPRLPADELVRFL